MPEKELPPSASASILSLRAFDYDLASALADLVDNSISANSNIINIESKWDSENSWIAVIDNGNGMTEDVLHEAMRLGSTSPSQKREPHDLGRFGLGLKTASIWACMHLTVLSKKSGGKVVIRSWDVDRVIKTNRWLVGDEVDHKFSKYIYFLENSKSGTVVLWQKMDTLYSGGSKGRLRTKESFLKDLTDAVSLLGMTFNRFIERHENPVIINSGGGPIESWSPEFSNPMPEFTHKTSIALNDQTVKISTLVMPHPRKMSETEVVRAGGPKGWNAHQGFYIYRNDRLIVGGGWLGLFQAQDHYKLARVIVEIPNSLDSQLGISVTKTSIRLPEGLRADLITEANAARVRSVEVYRHRGRKITSTQSQTKFAMPWEVFERDGSFYYLLNKTHPLYKIARDKASDDKAFSKYISLIEETLPYADIVIRNAEKPESFALPFEKMDEEGRMRNVREVYELYHAMTGSRDKALELISKTPPICNFIDEISKL